MKDIFQIFFANDSKMSKIKATIDEVAKTDITVLIKGESGTGKELLAQAIHSDSHRKDRPFIKVNCATIPKGLLESELFGFEKGAFTGAHLEKPGKFELANNGTILLNDIGEIDISIQAKLLQVLQDGVFSRLGGNGDVTVDTRVIATTKDHLERTMMEGHFREDLFFRVLRRVALGRRPTVSGSHRCQPHGVIFLPMKRRSWPRSWPTTSANASIANVRLRQSSIRCSWRMASIAGVAWTLAGQAGYLRSSLFGEMAASPT